MKTAIVTGASRGIGHHIAKRLCDKSYRVFGLSRSAPQLQHDLFEHIPVDLLNEKDLACAMDHMRAASSTIDLVVFNAGIGCFGPHEQLPYEKLKSMLRINLEVPLLMTRHLLRDIRESQGRLVFVSSVAATKKQPYGCAYTAAKAGLVAFADSLFEETRKSGIKITTILPDMTDTTFFDDLDFSPEDDPLCRLSPESVADALIYALSATDNMCVESIRLRVQHNRIRKKGTPGK